MCGAGAGWDGLRGRCELELCGCGAGGANFSNSWGCGAGLQVWEGVDKKFQPMQDSSQRITSVLHTLCILKPSSLDWMKPSSCKLPVAESGNFGRFSPGTQPAQMCEGSPTVVVVDFHKPLEYLNRLPVDHNDQTIRSTYARTSTALGTNKNYLI